MCVYRYCKMPFNDFLLILLPLGFVILSFRYFSLVISLTGLLYLLSLIYAFLFYYSDLLEHNDSSFNLLAVFGISSLRHLDTDFMLNFTIFFILFLSLCETASRFLARLRIIRRFTFTLDSSYISISSNNSALLKSTLNLMVVLYLFSWIGFFSSPYFLEHYSYLLSNRNEYYTFVPQISSRLLAINQFGFVIFIGIAWLHKGSNLSSFPLTHVVSFLAFLINLSINSRWSIVIFILYSVVIAFKFNPRSSSLQQTLFVLTWLLVTLIVAIVIFDKVHLYRGRQEGFISNIMFLKISYQYGINFFDRITSFVASFLNFSVLLNAANYKLPTTPFFYDLIALNPLPSAFLGLGSDYFNSIDRVSQYAPTPGMYQIYANGIIYWFVSAFFFSIPLSIGRCQSKQPNSFSIVRLFLNFTVFLALFMSFQYPLRSSVRYISYSMMLMCLIVIYRSFSNPHRKRVNHGNFKDD